MKKIKPFLRLLQEIVLIGVVLFYWIDTGWSNHFAWVFMGLLIFQLILRNITTGLVVGAIFAFLSLWMLLAFLSDALKIKELTSQARTFILFGSIFCGLLLTASSFMIVKYSRKLDALDPDSSKK